MARKGKNKTGPRSCDGSTRRPNTSFALAAAQGNRDKQTSSVSARAALEQLQANGFWVLGNDKPLAELTKKQREGMAWVARHHGIPYAKISNTGYSLYLQHQNSSNPIILPFKDMLSFEAVDKIKELTGIALMPAVHTTHERAQRFGASS